MIYNIRLAEQTLGNGKLKISASSMKNINSRRSIYISNDIRKGEIFNENNIKIVRPAFGLHPKFLKKVIGKKSKKNLKKGDRLNLKYVSTK